MHRTALNAASPVVRYGPTRDVWPQRADTDARWFSWRCLLSGCSEGGGDLDREANAEFEARYHAAKAPGHGGVTTERIYSH